MEHTIVLDIGHGIDTIGKGVPGLREFDFNQAVVKYAIELAKINNITVVLTQPFDNKEVALKDRTKLINNSNDIDLVVSVHADYNDNKDVRGNWVFYWFENNKARKLATIWNKHSKNILSIPNRGIVPSTLNSWTNFHMVREVKNIPSILVEHGFMSNSQDLKLLKDDGFRKLCAEVIIRTVCEYLNIPFKEEDDNKMLVNVFGKEIELENVVAKDNLNYIQLRELFTKLNCKVVWKDGKTTITLK